MHALCMHTIEVGPNFCSQIDGADAAHAAHSWLHATLRLLTFRFHTRPHKYMYCDGQ
jgi:hypothetical protein